MPAFRILSEMFYCSLRYNISFIDYFELRFYELTKAQRSEYVGSGAMYEYQLKMNPKKFRGILLDKIEFLKKFRDLAGRDWITLEMMQADPSQIDRFLQNSTGKIVMKNARGQAGKEIDVCATAGLDRIDVIQKMRKGHFDLLETYIVQNDRLMALSSSGLNTLRIITQYHQNEITVLAARLRISINSKTDNISTGNVAAHIDLQTGKVAAPAIYGDITKGPVFTHPVTGAEIVGFTIPFWNQCLDLVKKAALLIPENRSIGWDVAITNNGPVLVEGNHNWHYFLWQMPERKGYKKLIEGYANGIRS